MVAHGFLKTETDEKFDFYCPVVKIVILRMIRLFIAVANLNSNQVTVETKSCVEVRK